MSTAYGYARISHKTGLEKGESIPSQYARIASYFDHRLEPEGVEWGGIMDDGTNISAYRTNFMVRPAGIEIMKKLKKGDHLIVDKVDRLWRNLPDFVELMARLKDIGVSVHIVQFLGESICSDTALGDFTLKLMVLIAELESSIKSERTKEALKVAKLKGKKLGGNRPPVGARYFTKAVGEDRKIRKELRWCPRQRAIMEKIHWYKIGLGLSWDRAAPKIEEFIADLDGREPRKRSGYERDMRKWQRYLRDECAIRYLKIRDPSEVPNEKCRIEAYKQYKRERVIRTRSKTNGADASRRPTYTPEEILQKWG